MIVHFCDICGKKATNRDVSVHTMEYQRYDSFKKRDKAGHITQSVSVKFRRNIDYCRACLVKINKKSAELFVFIEGMRRNHASKNK